MSFSCEHCHLENTEIQSAGQIQERGIRCTFVLDHMDNMERQIVISDTASFRIEDLDVEMPPGHGKLSNFEGILSGIAKDLELDQKRRKLETPDIYEKIDTIIQTMIKMLHGDRFPFTIEIDDPAGNSWIEPSPQDPAKKYMRLEYMRTPQQNAALGLTGDKDIQEIDETENGGEATSPQTTEGGPDFSDIQDGLLYSLPCECPGCAKPSMMNLQMVNIPYFKQVIISASNCEHCGYRTNDVKTGGEIPERGRRIWLQVKNLTDLHRDILKSETCLLKIPECDVEVVPGTMGGRFTTVEGILTQIRDDLHISIFDVGDENSSVSDSMPDAKKSTWVEFFNRLNSAINGEMEYTILLEDPLANSYVQSLQAPEADPQIFAEEYERTAEEEEELGLTDMKTHMNANGDYVREIKAVGVSNEAMKMKTQVEAQNLVAESSDKAKRTDELQKTVMLRETDKERS